MDFSKLKRSNSLDVLKNAIQSSEQKTQGSDKDNDVFWVPTVDKAGNGMAVIRFLPGAAVDGDDAVPWVQEFKHGFQGPGGWLIDICPTTAKQQCPVCDYNKELWNSGIEANKEVVRKQKRKLNYIANIYVISDPANPENEGKVFLFKFGKKIFDKIREAMEPPFPDEAPINPFDLWEGANFKLKMRKVEGYRNYDKSEFDSPSALFDDDDKLENIWKQEHSLKTFVDPSKIPSYEKLQNRLNVVLGNAKRGSATNSEPVSETYSRAESIDIDEDIPDFDKAEINSKPVNFGDDDDDDELFRKLIED